MGQVMKFKNLWGAAQGGVDPQRPDLFRVTLVLPPPLTVGLWDEHCQFAIEKWPFPDRAAESVPIKYMQQVNKLIGGDVVTPPIDVTVRYAFTARTLEILERWFILTRNYKTGAVALTTQIKSNGYFEWLIPNRSGTPLDQVAEDESMEAGATYFLEGVWIKNFKPSDADMNIANGYVTATFTLEIDRYYPMNPSNLYVQMRRPIGAGAG